MTDWTELRALIFDPDKVQAGITLSVVRQLHCGKVAMATTAKEALEILRKFEADFVLVALHKDEAEAEKLIKRLRDRKRTPRPHIPVIGLVSSEDPYPIGDAISIGVDFLVARPFSANSLGARIEKLLRKPVEQFTTEHYVGPCRRRLSSDIYDGPERRRNQQESAA